MRLDRHGVRLSYSGHGQCRAGRTPAHNAVAACFFGTLRDELIHRSRFSTHAEARRALARYVEVFRPAEAGGNHPRRHSAPGYQPPAAHEAAYHQAAARAA